MPPIVIAAGVAGVASLAGAGIQAYASGKAAKTQAKAAERASNLQASTAKDIAANNQAAMSPYMNLGQIGMGLLMSPSNGQQAWSGAGQPAQPMRQAPAGWDGSGPVPTPQAMPGSAGPGPMGPGVRSMPPRSLGEMGYWSPSPQA